MFVILHLDGSRANDEVYESEELAADGMHELVCEWCEADGLVEGTVDEDGNVDEEEIVDEDGFAVGYEDTYHDYYCDLFISELKG